MQNLAPLSLEFKPEVTTVYLSMSQGVERLLKLPRDAGFSFVTHVEVNCVLHVAGSYWEGKKCNKGNLKAV